MIGEARGEVRGEARGKARGELLGGAREIIALGKEFGMSDEDIILKLQERLHIDRDKSREFFEQFGRTHSL